MKPSLLVTGASGFIGSRVVALAQQQGWQVTGLSRSKPASERATKEATYLHADLSDPQSLQSALEGKRFSHVINLAGKIDHRGLNNGGRTMMDVHFGGAMNLVSICRHDGLRGFVQVGSSDEYGDQPAPQQESMRERPISPYALAKLSATRLMEMLHLSEGFPAKAARLFLVYGPGQDGARFIPQLIRGCLDGGSFPVSEGRQLRDFSYVDDIAGGLLELVDCDSANGQCLNLASGNPVSIRQLIERVVERIGGGQPEYGAVPYRPGESMALYADMSKTESLTGWRATTGIDCGIARTVEWYRDRSRT